MKRTTVDVFVDTQEDQMRLLSVSLSMKTIFVYMLDLGII